MWCPSAVAGRGRVAHGDAPTGVVEEEARSALDVFGGVAVAASERRAENDDQDSEDHEHSLGSGLPFAVVAGERRPRIAGRGHHDGAGFLPRKISLALPRNEARGRRSSTLQRPVCFVASPECACDVLVGPLRGSDEIAHALAFESEQEVGEHVQTFRQTKALADSDQRPAK